MKKSTNQQPRKSNLPSLKTILLSGAILATGILAYTLPRDYRPSFLPSHYHSFYTRQLTTEAISNLNGVESIVAEKGNNPDVIVILQNHLVSTESDNGIYRRTAPVDSIHSITEICNQLHDKFNVKSLLPEGLDPSLKNDYVKKKKIVFAGNDSTGYMRSLEALINNRDWNLLIGEDAEEHQRLEKVRAPLNKEYQRILDKTSSDLKSISTKYSELSLDKQVKQEFEIKSKISSVNEELKMVADNFFTSDRTASIFDMTITQRDKRYAEICKSSKDKPIILIYGSAHCDTIQEHLRGMNYVIIKPQGLEPIKPITLDTLKERYYLKLNRAN